jgi:DNA-binding response OmpR family regulator
MRIALLEDDPDQAKLVQLWLSDAGHWVVPYGNGHDAVKGIFSESFDLLILDWLVPGLDGLEVLDWVRDKIDWPIPVLFITQRDTEKDVVTALEHGADDYMAKPIKQFEMLARIKAISRRVRTLVNKEKVIEFHPYIIDRTRRRVQHDGDEIFLTDKEFELAFFLFCNSGRVLSRGHILESVWGRSSAVNTRTVDTHVSRLRRKLQLSPEGSGWQLSSIYQHGYRLERIIS